MSTVVEKSRALDSTEPRSRQPGDPDRSEDGETFGR